MGREVRMVPPNWQHPIEWRLDRETNQPEINFVPLVDQDFMKSLAEWEEEKAAWDRGEVRDYSNNGWKPKDGTEGTDYVKCMGKRPERSEYMPEFPAGSATHLMMYENTSEGTPISPAFATPEELARWLADNNASAFAGEGASYEQWLRVCKGGYAPSVIITNQGMQSGVAGLT